MLASRLAVSTWIALVVFVAALAVAPTASAQGGVLPTPRSRVTSQSSSSSSSSSSGAASTGTPWGTRMEHWLAAGGALALGAVTVAIGTGLQRYAVDLNTHALQPTTTQVDAVSSEHTARDFLLAAEVMWSIGAALAGIGLTWVIVLSFSTPAPAAVAPEARAPTPTAALRVTPLGVTLEGVF